MNREWEYTFKKYSESVSIKPQLCKNGPAKLAQSRMREKD